jgi:hypothetical protein
MILNLDFTKEGPNMKTHWRSGNPWGVIHPASPYQYNAEYCVGHKKEIGLSLKCESVDSVEVMGPNGVVYYPDCAMGLVSSKFHFKYGRLDVEAILPKGKGLWPAIWTTAYDSWPPEIDIVEGYSEDRDNYGNLIIPGIRLQSNVHYREGENNRSIGGRNHWVWKNPTKHKIKYSLVWAPDRIEIFYDDCKVRSVKDEKILEEFNNSSGQYIVLNNATQPEKWDCGTSEFIVSSLTLDTERLIW